jgi:hypothetical protein
MQMNDQKASGCYLITFPLHFCRDGAQIDDDPQQYYGSHFELKTWGFLAFGLPLIEVMLVSILELT